MVALFLAPIYLAVCFYVLNWMLKWMTVCNNFFSLPAFRYGFSALYILTATTLLSSFLIKKPAWLHRILKQISNLWLGTFLYALLGIGIADLVRIILYFSWFSRTSWFHSRWMFAFTGFFTGALILFFSFYGFLHAKKLYTTRWNIHSDKTCSGHSNLKIVLIADLHLGYNTDEHFLKRLVRRINKLQPDLVVVAGDTFDNEFHAISHPQKCASILADLQSTYGTYCCYGNHDLDEAILAGFTFGGQKEDADERFEQFFHDAHMTLLDDEIRLIDNRFYLIGRKDPARCKKLASETGRMTPKQLTEHLDHSKPILIIDHQPKELSLLADAGADLILGGHTHNGQLFPGNLFLPLMWENPYGILKKGKAYSIVTSGAGIWGPNMRLGTKSEICLIEIQFDSVHISDKK